jgi:WD40 repeat protein
MMAAIRCQSAPSPAWARHGGGTAAASGSTILVCDTATGAEKSSAAIGDRLAQSLLSPDLGLLAMPLHQDVDLLDAATGKIRRTLPDHHGTARPLAFSGDGKTLAVHVSKDGAEIGYHSDVVLWDVTSGAERITLTGLGFTRQAAFTPDCKRLVVLGETKFFTGTSVLRSIETATGRSTPPVPVKAKKSFYLLSLSGDGRTIAVGSGDGTVHLFDMQ